MPSLGSSQRLLPALATLLAASSAGKKGEVRLVLTAERAQALQKRGLGPLPVPTNPNAAAKP